jgi:SAM-dependent methyltransferase
MLRSKWITTSWQFVRAQLPAAPATVMEIGCGPSGGFVPALREGGYGAIGVDPAAPDGPDYRQVRFEHCETSRPFDVVIACTSLHHVDDLEAVVDRIGSLLAPEGKVVVIEWAWERFDTATASWCFERLTPTASAAEPGWLHGHRDGWQASGAPWDRYFTRWVTEHGLHAAARIIGALDHRFDRRSLSEAPYVFSSLDDTSAADEQAAIDAGTIEATGVHYVATRRSTVGRHGSHTEAT